MLELFSYKAWRYFPNHEVVMSIPNKTDGIQYLH